jgi:hypothetical protein
MEQKSAKVIPLKSSHDARPGIRIWGTGKHSLWEISAALRALRVSHTVQPFERHLPARLIDMKFPQPTAVHLTQRVDGFKHGAVNFISASVAELTDTNFPSFPHKDLEHALKQMLRSDEAVVPVIITRDAANYVGALAQPSLLNKMQTEMNRIQPYSLRKEVKALSLAYFNSTVSIRETMRILERSMKTERLKESFKLAQPLREAVAQLKHKSMEEVAAETGFSTFDLRYLTAKAKPKKE